MKLWNRAVSATAMLVALVIVVLYAIACVPQPTQPQPFDVDFSCIGNGNCNTGPSPSPSPNSGGGTGGASCEALVRIGVASHGTGSSPTGPVRVFELRVGESRLLDATGHGAGGARPDHCNAATPIAFQLTQLSGAPACELSNSSGNPWTPTVHARNPGTCTIKAVSGSVVSNDQEDVNVTVSAAGVRAADVSKSNCNNCHPPIDPDTGGGGGGGW